MGYSCRIGNEADFAKARVEGVNASYKDLAEVCGNIRRKPVEAAVLFLEDAAAGKRVVRYRSHNTRMAHRKELMGQKGRWPMKAAGIVLKCLLSAVANARVKGLSEDLIVVHACANKKETHMRYSSKGRRNISRLQTSRVEVVLKEKEEGKKKRVEGEKRKKAEEAAKAAAEKKDAETKKGAKTPIKKAGEEKTGEESAKGTGKKASEAKAEKKADAPKGPAVKKGDAPGSAVKKAERKIEEKAEKSGVESLAKPMENKGDAKPEAKGKNAEGGGETKPETENAKPETKDAGEKKEVA